MAFSQIVKMTTQLVEYYTLASQRLWVQLLQTMNVL